MVEPTAVSTEPKRIDCRTVDSFEKGKFYIHPNAASDGECAEGCCDSFSCPDCGRTWFSEVPQ